MRNFLETVKVMVTPDLVNGLAGRLGENEGGVSKALSGILPLVLGGLIHRASTGDGTQSVFNMAHSAFQQHGGGLASSTGLLGLMGSGAGSSMLSSIFGGGADTLAAPVSSYAGIKPTSASSLLGLVGTAIPSLLGQHVRDNDLTPGGLGSTMPASRWIRRPSSRSTSCCSKRPARSCCQTRRNSSII